MANSFFRSAAAAGQVSLRVLAVAGLAWGAMAPLAAQAQAAKPDTQEAQPARDEPAEGDGNEIIVTATKREQTLQDVPVAVTVTTAETIERAHIRDIKDLASVVPSLRVAEHQSSAQTDFNIRGFGNGANNAGIEPSVGVFIDGVYRSRSAAQIADFPDVKRVEVLRGPQSTLFGKNASAGVISIVTASPQFHLGASAEASYGNYNAVVLKGMVTGPVSDTLALSIAGGYNRRDGMVADGGTGGSTNDRNRWFVRGQALWQPSSALKVRLIGDYGRIDEVCCAVVNIRASAATAAIGLLGGRVNPASDPFGTVYNNFDSTNHIKNYGVSGQVDYQLGPLTLTSITAWRKNRNQTNQDSDFTSLDLLGRNYADVDIRTFTQEFRASTNMDGPINFVAGAYYFNEKINQTGQLYYGTQAQSYANLLIQQKNGCLGVAACPGLTFVTGALGTLQGAPAMYFNANGSSKFFQAGTGLDEKYALKNEAISVFGQVDFKIAPKLTLTAGINYTHDKKRFDTTGTVSGDVFAGVDIPAVLTNAGLSQQIGNILHAGTPATAAEIAGFAAGNAATYTAIRNGVVAAIQTNPLMGLRAYQFLPPFLNVPNAVEPGRTSDGNVSYTARLAYDLTSKVNLYLSYATGFKASSINLSRDSRPALSDQAAIVAGGLALANQAYGSRFAGPEKSTVYEAGLKANWGIATLNFALFKESIKGFQSNLFTGTGFVLGNAGKESVFGFEFEGNVHVTPELTLSQALTYLKPKYDSYVQSPFGDASGHEAASIPPLSMTFAATWDHRFGNGDHFIARGDWHYESATQIEDGLPGFITTDPVTGAPNYQPGIDIARQYKRTVSEFDASLTYAMANGLEVSVWGRNLTDNRYFTVIFDSPLQTGSISAYPNQPRTYGISAMYKF
ncbi:MAG: TonB-dependent receptor [Sphingomonadales bacterium]|nr:TonB-dependent receptor [Sphingomonadales bacterium]